MNPEGSPSLTGPEGLEGTCPPPLVRMIGISKRFGPVPVLRSVDVEVRRGEVLILAGENGAGKSTLIKILGGVHTEYEGDLEVAGRRVRPRSPLEANALGIAVIYQELSLVPSLSVADNIFLGRPLTRRGFVRDGEQRREAERWFRQLGIPIPVTAPVDTLSIAQQQLTEIVKALSREAQVIVMDEPTSALNAPEVDRLFGLIAELKGRGCGIVYITHKMEEIERIGDRITVLRDGERVGTAAAAELPPARLIEWMVGRQMDAQFPRHTPQMGEERLRLESFSVRESPSDPQPAVDGVSLSVRAGEIVGVGGLQGSGASQLFLGLFGAYGRRVGGKAWLDGRPLEVVSPRAAIRQGVALLTSDRKATGLVLPLSITANATLADLPRLSPGGWRRPAREVAVAEALGRRLSLRAASLGLEVNALSGGNQQKVALAKWLQTEPRLLLLDEPTRGIDVGAKRDVYALMNALTAQGLAILLITSELPELLALSDRIVVLHRGRVTARMDRGAATPEKVLAAAMGATAEPTVVSQETL
ncbi:MAG TPA: sugar ABC transporter ATP-binding protein [Verrucomicrobiota bacterium]|nr:sugar ABC transporter ATP-binding protein [Verrucomicrobiota bacterium]HNU52029.1 sugar ABC transporter ATP-binding protein [Verrucomicrobiota bacterium]